MLRSMYSAISGLRGHQEMMDVIANNIANVNTTGYKASRVNFQDVLSQTQSGATAPTPGLGGINPAQVGLGMTVAGVDVKFLGVTDTVGPNYNAKQGRFELSREGRVVGTLSPERRFYASQRSMPMTEAAIDRSPLRDLYVSLGDDLGGGSWTVRVHYKPLVNWIWIGCVIMALGGLLGALDPRYRRARRAQRETASGSTAAMGAE